MTSRAKPNPSPTRAATATDEKAVLSPNIAATLFRELRRQILSGELGAGERLPGERELAQRYETNRNTLREAVRMLEQARLVTVRHGQGVTISDFRRTGTLELLPPFLEHSSDPSDVAHLLEDILPARLLVLEFAAKLAARRADKDDIARLRDITDLMIAAFERADLVVIAHGFQRWLDALIDSGHSAAVRWSFQRIAGRITRSFLSKKTEPCIWPERPIAATAAGFTLAWRTTARTVFTVAVHQSSGFCSLHNGLG